MSNKYEFGSPGRPYKKVKTVSLRLFNCDGEDVEHNVSVYLHSSGTPTFCIALPCDYYDTWVDHPAKEGFVQKSMRCSIDVNEKIIRAPSFDIALEALKTLSHHWREHYANRSMTKCIFVILELVSKEHRIEPPSFSSSATLVGLTVRWGYRVGGREYQHQNSIDDPLTAQQPAFSDLALYQGAHNGKNTTLPFTDDLWRELLKIQNVLERAADRLAMLANESSAIALLTSLATGVPLLSADASSVKSVGES